eukprot:TRINITY_DN8545_c1_g1_i6.p2 TRINITY_DN8545_c1_g1~~TRINITY_DN8545_c1_g1_i6.p2  ORF type:complete len:118 (-),score=17.01 TRINITY_DN8545_c1_g1_i6:541-894(-)
MAWSWQSFGEEICQLVVRANMRKKEKSGENILANEMTINFNVLGPLMKDEITCNLNGASIISIKGSCLANWNTKFSKEATKPKNLTASKRHRFVFSFSRRFRHCSLLFALPRDERGA